MPLQIKNQSNRELRTILLDQLIANFPRSQSATESTCFFRSQAPKCPATLSAPAENRELPLNPIIRAAFGRTCAQDFSGCDRREPTNQPRTLAARVGHHHLRRPTISPFMFSRPGFWYSPIPTIQAGFWKRCRRLSSEPRRRRLLFSISGHCALVLRSGSGSRQTPRIGAGFLLQLRRWPLLEAPSPGGAQWQSGTLATLQSRLRRLPAIDWRPFLSRHRTRAIRLCPDLSRGGPLP